MYSAISSIQFFNHVLLVLCVVGCVVCSDAETKVVQIFGSRIVPEHSDLSLECEVVSEDFQNASLSWYFSENVTPINSNKYHSSTNGQSTLQMKNMLRQQSNIYYCCLNDSTTICATHSVIVLYNTMARQIIPINGTSGVLILTKSGDDVPSSFDFALCLRYRWQFENVDIIPSSRTENHYNDTVDKSSDRTLLWKHLYYNVEFTLRTGNRLFEVHFSDNVSEATYYLHVFLNGNPKPKMHDIKMLPDTEFMDLNCWGTSFPAPKVTFSFTPCPSLEWNNCNNSPIILDEITSTGSSSSITFNESIKVIGSSLSSGVVHCKATNSEGTSWAHSKLYQMHQRETMMLINVRPTTTIYIEDSITVQCSVDRYNFTNRFTFQFNHQQEEVLGVQDNFNWVANLTLNNVTPSDNQIVCAAPHKNGTVIRKTLALSIIQPYIDAPQRQRHLLAKPGTQLVLNCDVTGRPMPEFRWYENDIELPYTNFMMVASISGDDKFECVAWNRAGVLSLTWMISQPSVASLEFNSKCVIAIVLLVVVIAGAVLCYFRSKQLCTLLRYYKSLRNR